MANESGWVPELEPVWMGKYVDMRIIASQAVNLYKRGSDDPDTPHRYSDATHAWAKLLAWRLQGYAVPQPIFDCVRRWRAQGTLER